MRTRGLRNSDPEADYVRSAARYDWLVERPQPGNIGEPVLLCRCPDEREATRMAAYFGRGAIVRREAGRRKAKAS